jgi:hypothetical protein
MFGFVACSLLFFILCILCAVYTELKETKELLFELKERKRSDKHRAFKSVLN